MLGYNHYGKAEVTLLRKDAVGNRAYNACQSGYNVYNGNSLDSFCNEQHIQCLDPVIRACLVNVPIPTTDGHVNGTWSATVRNLMRKCFSLSAAEVGNGDSDGTAFSYLSTQANRIAYQDETTTAVYWWLRSPYSSNAAASRTACSLMGASTATTYTAAAAALVPLWLFHLKSWFRILRTPAAATPLSAHRRARSTRRSTASGCVCAKGGRRL